MNKVEQIEKNIQKLKEVKSNTQDYKIPLNAIKDVVSLYENEIKNITSGLDALSEYESIVYWNGFIIANGGQGTSIEISGDKWKNDLDRLIEKLENYKISVQEKEKENNSKENQIKVEITNNNNNTNNNTNYNICTIENALSSLYAIPNEYLPMEDKNVIHDMLQDIENHKGDKGKSSFWEKVKNACKWILEKGSETAIATLPYILGIIK